MSQIPGAPIFDGREAIKGCALNRMCYSFNAAANRAARGALGGGDLTSVFNFRVPNAQPVELPDTTACMTL